MTGIHGPLIQSKMQSRQMPAEMQVSGDFVVLNSILWMKRDLRMYIYLDMIVANIKP